MTALRADTLAAHAARVAVPTYDRAALTPAVVHIGVGSFHRSHQAVYFDDLAQRGISREWGLVGAGLRRPQMRDVLAAQDGLYTLVTRGAGGDEARVIGVMGRYLYGPDDDRAVVAALADPRTRLVTLTLTANGYAEDARDRPGRPSSAVAHLVDALARRRAAALPPFTVLSCDNLPDNGAVARAAVLECAARRDQGLAAWVADHGAFPCSMVDRITPLTTPADCEFVRRRFGVEDQWPVITEPFRQWVVEDRFCAGRPPLDEVGVRFVADVRPYAVTKTRLLNAAHCALGHLGSLAGHRTTSEAMAEAVIDRYVTQLMAEEVSPLLPDVPGLDLPEYRAALRERLANPKTSDPLARLRRNASAKLPLHVVVSIAEARGRSLRHPLLTLAVAAWCRSLQMVDAQGRELACDDPCGPRLRRLARESPTDPRPLLAERAIFGDVGADPDFAEEVAGALEAIVRHGVHAAIAAHVGGGERLAA